MALTLYKSTDSGAPAMTSAAGSLISVLDACLVDGYGGKVAAGWSKAVIDAATKQVGYTQGAVTGLTQKKAYVKDDATYPGNAYLTACDSFTIAASPVLTRKFTGYGYTVDGWVLKANQEAGSAAAWMVLATDRWFYVITRRDEWGAKGAWAFAFIGDLDTPYTEDKGKFATAGWSTSTLSSGLSIGSAGKEFSDGYITAYGNPDGTYGANTYNAAREIGLSGGVAANIAPSIAFNRGVVLTRYSAFSSTAYRGSLPCLFTPSCAIASFALGLIDNGASLVSADGRTLLYLTCSGDTSISSTALGRVFMDITGAL